MPTLAERIEPLAERLDQFHADLDALLRELDMAPTTPDGDYWTFLEMSRGFVSNASEALGLALCYIREGR